MLPEGDLGAFPKYRLQKLPVRQQKGLEKDWIQQPAPCETATSASLLGGSLE